MSVPFPTPDGPQMTTGRGAFPVTPLLQATTSIFSSSDCNLTKAVFTCRGANISKPASKKRDYLSSQMWRKKDLACEHNVEREWRTHILCASSQTRRTLLQETRCHPWPCCPCLHKLECAPHQSRLPNEHIEAKEEFQTPLALSYKENSFPTKVRFFWIFMSSLFFNILLLYPGSSKRILPFKMQNLPPPTFCWGTNFSGLRRNVSLFKSKLCRSLSVRSEDMLKP